MARPKTLMMLATAAIVICTPVVSKILAAPGGANNCCGVRGGGDRKGRAGCLWALPSGRRLAEADVADCRATKIGRGDPSTEFSRKVPIAFTFCSAAKCPW